MQIPQDLRYTEDHEWVRDEGEGRVRVGITDYAQDALGDIVFVDLPEEGRAFDRGETFAEVESTKSVAEVLVPFAGTVVVVNKALADGPEIVNSEPYGGGWFVLLDVGPADLSEGTMDAAAYAVFTE